MSEKAYCANNTKYYKHSNSSGEIGHVIRIFKKNENAFDELTQFNFGHSFSNYDENLLNYYNRRLNEAKTANPKGFKKNSTTFIDSVLIFDHELMEEILSTPEGQEKVNKSIQNYMLDFKKQYGYEPIGFQFHLDEGTFIDQKQFENISKEKQKYLVPVENEDGESGYLKRNMHAQAIFLNFDFEKNKAPHRNMRKQDWRDTQDLLHKHFKEYGFERGEPKLTNEKDHRSKAEIIKELKKEIEELKENQNVVFKEFQNKKNDYLDLMDEMDGIYEDSIRFNEIKNTVNDFYQKIKKSPKIIDFIQSSYERLKDRAPKAFDFIEKTKNRLLDLIDFDDSSTVPPPPLPPKNDEAEPEPEQKIDEPVKQLDSSEIQEELSNSLKEIEEKEKAQKAKIKKIQNARKHGRGRKN